MAKQSILTMSKQANAKSRMCNECAFRWYPSIAICGICSKAFEEGFIKGYKKCQKQLKESNL